MLPAPRRGGSKVHAVARMTPSAVPSPCPGLLLLPRRGDPSPAGKEKVGTFPLARLEPALCVRMCCSRPRLRCGEDADAGGGRSRLLDQRCRIGCESLPGSRDSSLHPRAAFLLRFSSDRLLLPVPLRAGLFLSKAPSPPADPVSWPAKPEGGALRRLIANGAVPLGSARKYSTCRGRLMEEEARGENLNPRVDGSPVA